MARLAGPTPPRRCTEIAEFILIEELAPMRLVFWLLLGAPAGVIGLRRSPSRAAGTSDPRPLQDDRRLNPWITV